MLSDEDSIIITDLWHEPHKVSMLSTDDSIITDICYSLEKASVLSAGDYYVGCYKEYF